MFARPARAVALLVLTVAALGVTGCVRGRNDGGHEAAGEASNGAGGAPQPGPLAGQNTDTTSLAPASASAPAAATKAP